jgi:nitroreductase
MNQPTFDEIIRMRRSIRSYTEKVPTPDHVRAMLESACYAPSPSHTQPVRFLSVESKELREDLHGKLITGRDDFLRMLEEKGGGKSQKNLVRTYFRFAEFMVKAPLLFAVGTVETVSLSSRLMDAGVLSENPKGFSDADISTGLALSAFMLKGAELGIGTCVLTAPFVYIPGLSRKIHPDIRVTCFVTAGYPAETPRPLKRMTPEEICLCL